MQNKYRVRGDFEDIKKDEKGDLIVLGFRNEAVRDEL
jgi:hypothetical protein